MLFTGSFSHSKLYCLYRALILCRRSTVVCFVFIQYNQKFFSRESLQNFLELLNLANCGWNTATSCWRIKSASVCTSSKQKAVTVVGERKTKLCNALGRESINSFKVCMLAKLSRPLLYVSRAVSQKSASFYISESVCSGIRPFVMSQTHTHLHASATAIPAKCSPPPEITSFQTCGRFHKASLPAGGYQQRAKTCCCLAVWSISIYLVSMMSFFACVFLFQ